MSEGAQPVGPRMTMRADKWLWHARFFKTRGLASKVVTGGHLRVNSLKVAKAAHAVGPGDVLTFPQAKRIRVIKIAALSDRRGPASEAQTLYQDLTPVEPATPAAVRAPKYEGKGRPNRKDRRNARLYDPSQLD